MNAEGQANVRFRMLKLGDRMETAICTRDNSASGLIMVEQAKALLVQATSLGEVKDIRDKAAALQNYMKQASESLEAQNAAAEVKIRAERRAGEILAEMPKAVGGEAYHETPTGCIVQPVPSLSDLGIEKTAAHRWQTIAVLPEDDFEEHIAEAKESGRELTSSAVYKEAKQYKARNSPILFEPPPEANAGIVCSLDELVAAGRKFRTIYADPPWRYGNQGTRASTDNHYDTMTVDQICAEPVSKLVEDDAHLHLWTTNAFLLESFRVMEAWGFTYKSVFVWVKPQMGIGNYWRVSHEFMLFGIRGKAPFGARNEMSWAKINRTKHSAKPDEVRQKIEKVSPGPYLEMYGRVFMEDRPWTVYGNQVSRSIAG